MSPPWGAAHAGDSPDGVRSGRRPREIQLAASYFLVATLLFLFGRPSPYSPSYERTRSLNGYPYDDRVQALRLVPFQLAKLRRLSRPTIARQGTHVIGADDSDESG
ncbi:MAG: hypothetical protein QOH82_3379 [Mycobacterium sp.]|nr:hypothetical protein [Mycobacterium sp.]